MPKALERIAESVRQGNNAPPTSFRSVGIAPPAGLRAIRLGLSFPNGLRDNELTSGEVDVAPTQAEHLAAPQSRIAAEQNHDNRSEVELSRSVDQSLVLRELIEARHRLDGLHELDGARRPLDHLPSACRAQDPA